ncbi:MAG: hypothetical protein JNK02_03985 [Planctomycetes bacterium]|nr:hypothetical protein [Planctomycetota bacterium]
MMRRQGLVLLGAVGALASSAAAQGRRLSGQQAGGGTLVDAPEINPNLMIGLAVLLVGGVLILTSRMRRRANRVKSS